LFEGDAVIPSVQASTAPTDDAGTGQRGGIDRRRLDTAPQQLAVCPAFGGCLDQPENEPSVALQRLITKSHECAKRLRLLVIPVHIFKEIARPAPALSGAVLIINEVGQGSPRLLQYKRRARGPRRATLINGRYVWFLGAGWQSCQDSPSTGSGRPVRGEPA
jgi:hypothetical protein